MKQFLACLLVFALTCCSVCAEQPDQKHIESIKKKVANCIDNQRAVAIETYDGRHLQGSIGEAGTDSFVLSFKLQNTTLAYSDVKKIKWHSELSRQSKGLIAAAIITGGIFALVILIGGTRD
jgi:hypothetical protein